MNEILQLYRLHRNWETDFVASKLLILPEEYLALESGSTYINPILAIKLSELYNAPLNVFMNNESGAQQITIFYNCVFTNSNGYVNNLYK